MGILRIRRSILVLVISLAAGAAWAVPTAIAAPPANHRAGYSVATPSGRATAQTRFTVPTVTCPPPQSFAAVLPGAVLITSAGNTGSGVAVVCANGSASYIPDIQVNGASTTYGDLVAPGDTIAVTVSESPQSTNVRLANLTRRWTHTLAGGGGTVSVAFIGTSAVNCLGNGQCSTVDQMSPTHYSGATVDGRALGTPRLGAVAGNIVSSTGVVEATAGRLNFSRDAFTVRWSASCTPDPLTNRC